MPDAGILNPLLTTAQAYRDLGYVVIPLKGKVAAVPWAAFQRRKPDPDLIRHWFSQPDITGIGLLTGWISGLVILDFDTQDTYTAFQRHAPDLACTRTVRTRRGWHLYYQLPPTVNLSSQSVPGLDIQSHGRYVVAPPSIVDGHTYTVIGRYSTRILGPGDLAVLGAFTVDCTRRSTKPQEGPVLREMAAFPESASTSKQPSVPVVTPSELVGLYTRLAGKRGRNNALFQAGIHARDHGWSQGDSLDTLAGVHVQQPAATGHRRENAGSRQREAAATIASVYSRLPGKPRHITRSTRQLPNAVREALFGRKLTYTVRTLEGLRLKGILPGQSFTRQQALDLLRGVVGQGSVIAALYMGLDTPTPPSGHPPASDEAAISNGWHQQKNCTFVGAKKPFKIQNPPSNTPKRGRKAQVFVMPSNAELCELLGVTDAGGDALTLDDLKTAPGTRQAVHRELIRRRPGTYTRKWLAARLGVCLVTLDTYNRAIPINAIHAFTREQIGWHNLERVQEERIDPSVFLTDEDDRQYPALRAIAARLLKGRHTVYLLAQRPSFYWYGTLPVPACPDPVPHLRAFPQAMAQLPLSGGLTKQPATSVVALKPAALPGMPEPDPGPKPPARPPLPSRRALTRPLENSLDEKLAQDIHDLTRPDGLSILNARKLVDTYGYTAAGKGLANLRARVGRDPEAVKSRAGLLITVVRGFWKQAHQNERTIQFVPVKPRQTKRVQRARKRQLNSPSA